MESKSGVTSIQQSVCDTSSPESQGRGLRNRRNIRRRMAGFSQSYSLKIPESRLTKLESEVAPLPPIKACNKSKFSIDLRNKHFEKLRSYDSFTQSTKTGPSNQNHLSMVLEQRVNLQATSSILDIDLDFISDIEFRIENFKSNILMISEKLAIFLREGSLQQRVNIISKFTMLIYRKIGVLKSNITTPSFHEEKAERIKLVSRLCTTKFGDLLSDFDPALTSLFHLNLKQLIDYYKRKSGKKRSIIARLKSEVEKTIQQNKESSINHQNSFNDIVRVLTEEIQDLKEKLLEEKAAKAVIIKNEQELFNIVKQRDQNIDTLKYVLKLLSTKFRETEEHYSALQTKLLNYVGTGKISAAGIADILGEVKLSPDICKNIELFLENSELNRLEVEIEDQLQLPFRSNEDGEECEELLKKGEIIHRPFLIHKSHSFSTTEEMGKRPAQSKL